MKDNLKTNDDKKVKELKQNVMVVIGQIELELRSGKSKNPLKELTGKWPGDERLDDLLKQLEE